MGAAQSNVETQENDPFFLHLKQLYSDLADSESESQSPYLFKERFISFIGGPSSELGRRLFEYMLNEHQVNQSNPVQQVEFDFFLRAMSNLKTALSQKQDATCLFFNLFLGSESNTEEALQELVHTAASCALHVGSASQVTVPKDDPLLSAVVKAIGRHADQQSGMLEMGHFSHWLSLYCPHMLTGLCQWLCSLLQPVAAKNQEIYHLPSTDCNDEERRLELDVLVWILSCVLPSLYMGTRQEEGLPMGGTWTCLYSSRRHGFSMNRFQHHCFDYKQPSIMILNCHGAEGLCSFALAMDSEWRDGTYFYGGMHFNLIQLRPTYSLLKRGAKLVSLNEKQRGFPTGLRVMASERHDLCLLEVKPSLEEAKLMGSDDWLRVDLVEVWGCGGVEAMQTQQRLKEWETREILRRRKINKETIRETWKDGPDRYLLEMGGVTTSRPTEQQI